jgi:hypothetical protein
MLNIRRLAVVGAIAMAVAILAGCGAVVSPGTSAIAKPSIDGRPLPTTDPAVNACAGVETGPLVLTATPTGIYARTDTGQDLPIFWPPGFRAIFDPTFSSVISDRGAVFATAGEDINPYVETGRWGGYNACVTGSQVFLYGASP